MKKTLLALALTALSTQALAVYKGVLVDAHNQIGCDSKPEEISKIIKQSSVNYTLISGRKPCDKNRPEEAHEYALAVQQQLPDRTFFLISTKNGGKAGTSDSAYELLLESTKELKSRSVGYAEVLIQHAENDQKNNKTKGLTDKTIYSPEIQRTIKHIVDQNSPLTIHLETNDFIKVKSQSMRDLDQLLTELNPHPVILIHMAQLSAKEVKDLIQKHSNVYFFLSTADPINQRGIQRRKANNEVAQSGWITVLNGPGIEWNYRNPNPVIYNTSWKPEWKSLIEKNSSRFIFAIDSVYADPWKFGHPVKVKLWRERLGELDPQSARAVACGNAKRLWSLPITCTK
jgi:hypothetical protein